MDTKRIKTKYIGYRIVRIRNYEIVEIVTEDGTYTNYRNIVGKMVYGNGIKKGDCVEIEYTAYVDDRSMQTVRYNIVGISKCEHDNNQSNDQTRILASNWIQMEKVKREAWRKYKEEERKREEMSVDLDDDDLYNV